ncbi:unnamed protein product [Pseudo-nitzschia multistriata]|uniref:Uncharacterized protein n=1 Tax=Pseudo-nitzschia multistriata TaxID=183589 RepID=A0A448Z8C5_9STRA|nr:unnamed protein product [Pseudo-nitzschia multistriata]
MSSRRFKSGSDTFSSDRLQIFDKMEEQKCPVQGMSKMSINDSIGNDNGNPVSSPVRTNGTAGNENGNSNPTSGTTPGQLSLSHRVGRNKSGPLGRMMKGTRAPPKRSQSSKIGRPTFDPGLGDSPPHVEHTMQVKRRGVGRSQSSRVKGSTRKAPGRSGSFQRRRAPDRTNSSASSRRRTQKSTNVGTIETDDVSITDSVYTSVTFQTMDSITIRKKQMPPNQAKDGNEMSIEFDHSDNWIDHDDDGETYDYEDELSVFSESWSSTESCEVLSDFEEGEMDGAIMEDDEDKMERKNQNTTTIASTEYEKKERE